MRTSTIACLAVPLLACALAGCSHDTSAAVAATATATPGDAERAPVTADDRLVEAVRARKGLGSRQPVLIEELFGDQAAAATPDVEARGRHRHVGKHD